MPDERMGPINDPSAAATPGEIAEVIVFQHADFLGADKRTTEGWTFPQDSFWNDQISSIIVIRGRWRFFMDSYGNGQHVDLGPGRYHNEQAIGLPNDSISSFTYFA